MSWVAVAVAGAGLVGSMVAADSQGDAANAAAGAQTESARLGVEEQRRQFDRVRELLQPYVDAGTSALPKQQDLAGINGAQAQQAAIQALQQSPGFQSQLQLGENRMLANASATGGLRGGNLQAALAQFAPHLLAQTINDQYGRLGGFTSIGQNAAAGVGNAGMQTGNNITSLLQGAGGAQAQAALAGGRAQAGMWGGIGQAAGTYFGMGGQIPGFGQPTPDSYGQWANSPMANTIYGTGGLGD